MSASSAQAAQLQGRLVLSNSGQLVLEVPNAIGQGAFRALSEAGIELPSSNAHDAKYRAHILVMTEKEVAQIGPDNIKERGQAYHYELGKIRDFNPTNWPEVNRCWAITVKSPELAQLRKSYGLDPDPQNQPFQIIFAVRYSGVLGSNDKSKITRTPKEKAEQLNLPEQVQPDKRTSDQFTTITNSNIAKNLRGPIRICRVTIRRVYGPETLGIARAHNRLIFTPGFDFGQAWAD